MRWRGYTFYAGVAYAKGDFHAAEERVLALRERAGPGNQFWRRRTSNQLARLSMLRGRLGAAEGHYLDAIAVSEKSGVASIYLANTRPLIELFLFRGEADAGLEKLEAALERYPLATVAPLDRPYLDLANIYARAGRVDQAKALLADFEANVDPIVQRRYKPWHHRSLGHVALAEGRFREAIAEFRRQDESSGCPLCALPHLGEAHDLAGEPDSAIALYERYIATPSFHRGWFDPYFLAPFYERLGELYEARGDTQKAIYYYGKFVDLWKDADPVLQPRVEAARVAAKALSREM